MIYYSQGDGVGLEAARRRDAATCDLLDCRGLCLADSRRFELYRRLGRKGYMWCALDLAGERIALAGLADTIQGALRDALRTLARR